MTASSTPDSAPPRGVIAVGASAGGIEALKQLSASLSPDLPYAVLITLHMAAASPSVLAQIIDRSGPLPATQAVDGEHLRAGHVYVAVPDRHLLVRDHRIVVSRGPTEDGHRPAINPLMRSAAVAFGPRAIGVLLSGVLDDGVLGLAAIRSRGGVTVVQDPDDALFPDMPRNAIAAKVVDHEVAAGAAGRLFTKLAERDDEEFTMVADPAMELENRIAMGPQVLRRLRLRSLGSPFGLHVSRLQRFADVGRHDELPLPSRTRVDAGGAVSGSRQGDGERTVDRLAQPRGEGQAFSQTRAAVGPGALQRRYAEIARETERAVDVLRARLTELVDTMETQRNESTA